MSLGEMPLNAAVLAPADGASVAAGPVEVCGYAFAGGGRGVARVELSTDGGASWRRAALLEDQGRWPAALARHGGGRAGRARDRRQSLGLLRPDAARTSRERVEPEGYVNTSWGRVRLTVVA